jgi:anti-sigma factor RsiW
MSSAAQNDDVYVRLGAYLDGELDASAALEMERQIAADPALQKELARLAALQSVLRAKLQDEFRPVQLRARIEAATGLDKGGSAPQLPRLSGSRSWGSRSWGTQSWGSQSWGSLAASLLLGAFLSGAATWSIMHEQDHAGLSDILVSNHIRAQISDKAIDVASSDRHTVKPWLAGRLAISPTVFDLTADGFPLLGGRIDVINGQPVPTLVFKRDKHMISLTEWQTKDAIKSVGASRGYNIVEWREGDLTFVAVSDIQLDELQAFERLFKAAR